MREARTSTDSTGRSSVVSAMQLSKRRRNNVLRQTGRQSNRRSRCALDATVGLLVAASPHMRNAGTAGKLQEDKSQKMQASLWAAVLLCNINDVLRQNRVCVVFASVVGRACSFTFRAAHRKLGDLSCYTRSQVSQRVGEGSPGQHVNEALLRLTQYVE